MTDTSRLLSSILQVIALVAPSLYTGMFDCNYLLSSLTRQLPGLAFTYTHVVMPPLTAHASPKILAKQWLQAYQFAPVVVPPLILLGAFSNAFLTYLSTSPRSRSLYAVAAIAIASIIPYTGLYMEPGVNGAGKWKARELLRDEGFVLKGRGHGTDKDTASEEAKSWAERVDMKTIAETWARTNAWRYVITGVATAVSAVATVMGG